MAKVCIMCEKEPGGKAYAVKDDAIVSTIRTVKRKLGIAKNNELYVCEACLPVYKEKRKKFEKNLVFYAALAVVVFVLINGLQIFYGRFSFFTFFSSFVLALLIVGLAVINYATPPLAEAAVFEKKEVKKEEEKKSTKAKPKSK